MIEEAVSLNELALMGSMLLVLIKFESVSKRAAPCLSGCEAQVEGRVLQSDEHGRTAVLADLKSSDSSLQAVIKQC